MLERRLAHQPTAFDAEMILRDRKRIFYPNFLDGDAGDRFTVCNDVMRITCGTQQVAVETAALTHAVQTLAAVAQWNGDRIVRVPGRNQDCNFQLPRRWRRWWRRRRFTFHGWRCGWDKIVHRDLNEIARLHPKRFGVARTDQSSVVPGQFCDRIGHLLQPGVIDVTAVVD